jgi:hypothetical protein
MLNDDHSFFEAAVDDLRHEYAVAKNVSHKMMSP